MEIVKRIENAEQEAAEISQKIKELHMNAYPTLQAPKLPRVNDVMRVEAAKTLQRFFRGCRARRRAQARRRIEEQRKITEQLGIFYTANYHGYCDYFDVVLSNSERVERAEAYRIGRLMFSGIAAFRGCCFRRERGLSSVRAEEEDWSSSDTLW